MQLFILLFMVNCVYAFTSYIYARSVELSVFFFACVVTCALYICIYLYYGGESMFVTEDLLAYKFRLNIYTLYT